jgi:hypothetical protein
MGVQWLSKSETPPVEKRISMTVGLVVHSSVNGRHRFVLAMDLDGGKKKAMREQPQHPSRVRTDNFHPTRVG